MLFVGCDDEASEDVSLLWAEQTPRPHGDDESSPHKVENTEAERAK